MSLASKYLITAAMIAFVSAGPSLKAKAIVPSSNAEPVLFLDQPRGDTATKQALTSRRRHRVSFASSQNTERADNPNRERLSSCKPLPCWRMGKHSQAARWE